MAVLAEFELWLFLAGLGIFLFGMHMMEESIRVLSGAAFKSLIRRYTGTRPKAILSGMVSTAILQSSSAVSLMVLAFIGAGIMNLVQAIAVMMGAKIGTTATAWIVAVFGFQFNIDTFSLPLIGIGGLGIILLAKSPKYVNISRFLVAFGFLFMGLDYMKSSVDQISELIDPSVFAGYGILVFALVGLVMTAIMQSSSATIAIVLTMLFSNVIDFQAGAAMVVGANVGTTVTVLLGSIGGTFTKKQAALGQLTFTVGTAAVTLILLPFFIWLVLDLFSFQDNLVLGLALFHTIFNVAGVLWFYPLIPALARKAEKWIPEMDVKLSKYIHKTDPEIEEAGLEAFRKEIRWQLIFTIKFIESVFRQGSKRGVVNYSDLEKYNGEIFEYYSRIQTTGLDEKISAPLEELLRASRNIMNSAKNIHESSGEFLMLANEDDTVHQNAHESINIRIRELAKIGKKMEKITDEQYLQDLKAAVEKFFDFNETMDKQFISMCSVAVKEPAFKKVEITFLLMLNRLITQSCRMLIYGMRTLLKYEHVEQREEG
ncbi:MAG: Na/Pi cotransporter family protein [Balneolaceae bacterium]|nr:MAG: Na/Pi cotransporter family protein [Balneolaceae bacterium]